MRRVFLAAIILVLAGAVPARAAAGEAGPTEMARILVDYQAYMRGDTDAGVNFYLARAREFATQSGGGVLAELAMRMVLAQDPADYSAVDLGENEARRLLSSDVPVSPELQDLARRVVIRALSYTGRRDEAMAMQRQRGVAMNWSIAGSIAGLEVLRVPEADSVAALIGERMVGDVFRRLPDAGVFAEWRKNPPWRRVPESRAVPFLYPWRWTNPALLGAVALRTGVTMDNSDGQAEFHIYSDVSWRLYINGGLTAVVDRNNAELPREHVVTVQLGEGNHDIFVLLPSPPRGRNPTANRFQLRLVSASPFAWRDGQPGVPRSAPVARREAIRPRHLRELAELAGGDASLRTAYGLACAEQGMFDEACWQIAAAAKEEPDNLNIPLLAGLLHRYNPLLPEERRMDLAANWYRKTLEARPDIVPALLFLAEQAMLAERPEEAARRLAEAYAANPASLAVLKARGEWARKFSSAFASAEAWKELGEKYPRSLGAQRAIASMSERENMNMERRLAACRLAVEAGDSGPDSLMRLADALADGGASAEAASVVRDALASFPGDIDLLGWAGGLYARLALYDEAAAALTEALRLAPTRANVWRLLGDIAREQGREEDARSYWRVSLAADPSQYNLSEMLRYLSDTPEALEFDGQYDSAAMVAAAEDVEYTDDVVRLLDRSVVVMERDGSFRRLTHEIDLVKTRRGGELLADVSAPGELLTARTIFPNGDTLEPENIPGRSGLRLPALLPGTAREMQYLEYFPANGFSPPRQRPWFFQHPGGNMPYLLSEYEVWTPKDFPLVHVLRDYGLGVEFDQSETDNYIRYRWTARLGLSGNEPDAVHASENLASVEIGVRTTWDDVVYRELAGLSGRLTPSREMLTVLASLFRMRDGSRRGPEDSAQAIYRFVCDAVDPAPVKADEKASHTLANRLGDRNLLLLAMLRAAGFNAHMAAARPNQDQYPPAVWDLPRRDHFPVPLVRLSLPGGPALWLDSRFETLPFGKLADDLSEATVITFLPEGPLFDTLPRLPDSESVRFEERRLLLPDTAGALAVVGRISMKGVDGLLRREYMSDADVPVRRLALLDAIYPVFPDAVLQRLDIMRPPNDESFSHERYEIVSASTVTPTREGSYLVPLCLPAPDLVTPESRGMRSRATTCHVRKKHIVEDRNTFVLPKGGRFVGVPKPANLLGSFGLYQLRVIQRGVDQIEIIRRFRFPAQRIKPWEWRDFITFLDNIDLAERQWIEYVVE